MNSTERQVRSATSCYKTFCLLILKDKSISMSCRLKSIESMAGAFISTIKRIVKQKN